MAIANNTIRQSPQSIHHCEVKGENLIVADDIDVGRRDADGRLVDGVHGYVNSDESQVPDGVDVLEATFTTALTTNGLIAGTRTEANHPTIAAGNVISTDPPAGTNLAGGASVDYVVSLGPA